MEFFTWSPQPCLSISADVNLNNCRMWDEAEWLKFSEEYRSQLKIKLNEELVMTEKEKTAVATFTCSNSHEFVIYSRISKFGRFKNIAWWVKKFILEYRNRNIYFPSEMSTEVKEEGKRYFYLENNRKVLEICCCNKKIKGLKDQ